MHPTTSRLPRRLCLDSRPGRNRGVVCFSTTAWLAAFVGLAFSAAVAGPPLRPVETQSFSLPGPGPASELVGDQVVVKLRSELAGRAAELPEYGLPRGLPELDAELARHGILDGFRLRRTHGTPIRDMTLFKEIGLDRLYVLRLPDSDKASSVVEELSRQPWVEYAHPVYRLVPLFSPNDTFFPDQWPHDNNGQSPGNGTIDADMDSVEAWDTNVGDASAAIAILDSGIQMAGPNPSHPDLVDNVDVANGFDYVSGDPFPEDTGGHGTAVAGIAAAVGNNGLGVAGMCQGCRIFPFKISTSVHESNALMQAADNGADTINMSHTFGCNFLPDVKDAIDYAVGLGALPVASAGNFDGFACSIPAAFPKVVSAGGTDPNDNRIFTFSDYTEVAAPATLALTTTLTGGYGLFGGTSASSPYIAGLGALLRSTRNDLHVNQLRHILRLGADDQIGTVPDPPGWDTERGFGRINAADSMALLDQKWIALDRGHYLCEGDVTIAVQDATAGATLDVSIGSNGDTETVTLTKVAGSTDYYEGSIGLNWTDVFGPGTAGDGSLDATHGETITASDGPRTAAAFFDCTKQVCRTPIRLNSGDCDQDGSADPGETRELVVNLVNLQGEVMEDVAVSIATDSPWVDVLTPGLLYGDINPFIIVVPNEGPRIRVRAGAPTNLAATLDVSIVGRGFVTNNEGCAEAGYTNDTLTLYLNRDKGAATGIAYDMGDTGAVGFSSVPAHGTGELPECTSVYTNPWNAFPTNTRFHEGGRSWGTTGFVYSALSDGALESPPFTVPEAGGVLGWYHWIDTERAIIGGASVGLTWDGMILEAKRTADATWSYVADANYTHELFLNTCDAEFPFGSTAEPRLRLYSGDGDLTEVSGDSFDREILADLSDFAGEEIQVRWRFGSDVLEQEQGVWIDTVTVYDAYTADSWPGAAPQDVQGSDANCNAQFDITASAVNDATAYNWYRSEMSCLDAQSNPVPVATTLGPSYTDASVIADVEYFYAVEAVQDGTGCGTERACIAGGCCTTLPSDPSIIGVDKSGDDLRFTLSYAGELADVYRDPNSDPSTWGTRHASQIGDGSPAEPDFQYTDVGGLSAGPVQHYIFTGSRCGITLPPRSD